jgi:hypothetical protein
MKKRKNRDRRQSRDRKGAATPAPLQGLMSRNLANEAAASVRLDKGPGDVTCSSEAETDLLYKAVKRYVEAYGGTVAVVGPVTIQQWPHDNQLTFHVTVKCFGHQPRKPN